MKFPAGQILLTLSRIDSFKRSYRWTIQQWTMRSQNDRNWGRGRKLWTEKLSERERAIREWETKSTSAFPKYISPKNVTSQNFCVIACDLYRSPLICQCLVSLFYFCARIHGIRCRCFFFLLSLSFSLFLFPSSSSSSSSFSIQHLLFQF